VSPFVAGFYDSGTVTRATSFASKRLFWTGTLKPQLIRIEEKFYTDFFSLYAPEFYGKFDYTGVEELQEDLTESLDRAKKAFDLGWSMNEINETYNLGLPEKDFSGFRPMNYIKYDLNNEIEETAFNIDELEENLIENDEKSYKNPKIKSFSDNFIRIEGVMEKVLRSKLKKFFYNQRAEILKILNENKDFDTNSAMFLGKLGQIFDDSKQIIIEYVEPTYIESSKQATELAYKYLGVEKEFVVNPKILNDRLNKIKRVNDTVYKNLKNNLSSGISEGETISELSKRVKEFYNTLYNPSHQYLEKIARTETSSLMNGTQFEVYKEEGVNQKQWISEPDARDGHNIDGEVAPVNSPFSNGMMYPGDPSAGPEMVINCRCSISPYIE
jgi:SPP1 gp7 family putative phage head morphogenesis protein